MTDPTLAAPTPPRMVTVPGTSDPITISRALTLLAWHGIEDAWRNPLATAAVVPEADLDRAVAILAANRGAPYPPPYDAYEGGGPSLPASHHLLYRVRITTGESPHAVDEMMLGARVVDLWPMLGPLLAEDSPEEPTTMTLDHGLSRFHLEPYTRDPDGAPAEHGDRPAGKPYCRLCRPQPPCQCGAVWSETERTHVQHDLTKHLDDTSGPFALPF